MRVELQRSPREKHPLFTKPPQAGHRPFLWIAGFLGVLMVVGGCSFNYSELEEPKKERPDLMMGNVHYARIEGGQPTFAFEAEEVYRYEQQHLMNIGQMRFEKRKGTEQEVAGRSGFAQLRTDTGDGAFAEGFQIVIPSEGLTIEGNRCFWNDTQRILYTGPEDVFLIKKTDGSLVSGRGFKADLRRKSWSFQKDVQGIYPEATSKNEEKKGTPLPSQAEGTLFPVEKDTVNE